MLSFFNQKTKANRPDTSLQAAAVPSSKQRINQHHFCTSSKQFTKRLGLMLMRLLLSDKRDFITLTL